MLNNVQEWRVACVHHAWFLWFVYFPTWVTSLVRAVGEPRLVQQIDAPVLSFLFEFAIVLFTVILVFVVGQLNQTSG